MKTCYYELLGIERNATDSDIKKAYRRKALELHPDKNMHRIEEATELFAEVQQAYEILMDPQERAWYDSHREQILRGDDEYGMEVTGGYEWTNSTLLRYFSTSCFKNFDNSDKGFYTVFRRVFEEIEREEESVINSDPDSVLVTDVPMFTSFGYSQDEMEKNVSYGKTTLKEFYDKFVHFVTGKSFRWCDKYRLSDAPDRRVRRLMEKENKKLRDQAKKEFQEAVRNLALFVRKRDPRYAAFLKQTQEAQAEKAKLEKERMIEEKRKRLEEAQAFQEQDWMKVDEDAIFSDDYGSDEGDYDENENVEYQQDESLEENSVDGLDESTEEELEEEVLDLYCVACDKEFKSENQLIDHQRSKKHLKAVKALKKEMQREEKGSNYKPPESKNEEEDTNLEYNLSKKSRKKKKNQSTTGLYLSEDDHDNDEKLDEINLKMEFVVIDEQTEVKKEEVEMELNFSKEDSKMLPNEHENTEDKSTEQNENDLLQSKKKAGKPSLKNVPKEYCNVCKQEFPSRNKLFQHIKETGHALYKKSNEKKSKKKK